MTTLTGLAGAAVELAERGYHVFPCKPQDKRPLTTHGFKEATRDERKILHWWDAHPNANIGIACQASGIAVLDIDTKHGANPNEILQGRVMPGLTIVQTGAAPPQDASHPRSLEGQRGAQVYFRGQLRTGDTTLPGVEIRGTGAYVIAPPSIHPSGVAYGPSLPLPVGSLLEIPDWVQEIVDTRKDQPAAPIGNIVPKGEQHKTLVSLAGTMRRRGMNADAIEAALLVINEQQLEEPAPRENIREIARSVARYHPERALDGANAVARGDERYVLEIDDKGKLKLPQQASRADEPGHCAWLTAVFALDPQHPIIGGMRQGGRGADGHIALTRLDAPAIRFEPASKVNTPQRLVETLAWDTLPTDDAVPPFRAQDCRQIAHVIRMLCGLSLSRDAVQETAGIIGSYLSVGREVHGRTTYGDGRERYAAAEALKRDMDDQTGRQIGPAKYLVDENTGELVIPFDELQSVARAYIGGSLQRGWLEARLDDLGWVRAILDGHGMIGREGRQGPHNRRVVYRGHLPQVDHEQAA